MPTEAEEIKTRMRKAPNDDVFKEDMEFFERFYDSFSNRHYLQSYIQLNADRMQKFCPVYTITASKVETPKDEAEYELLKAKYNPDRCEVYKPYCEWLDGLLELNWKRKREKGNGAVNYRAGMDWTPGGKSKRRKTKSKKRRTRRTRRR